MPGELLGNNNVFLPSLLCVHVQSVHVMYTGAIYSQLYNFIIIWSENFEQKYYEARRHHERRKQQKLSRNLEKVQKHDRRTHTQQITSDE